jgi:hypothetical protein
VPIAMQVDGTALVFGQNCTPTAIPRSDAVCAIRERSSGLRRLLRVDRSVPGRDAVMYGLPVPEHYRIGVKYLDYWMLCAPNIK